MILNRRDFEGYKFVLIPAQLKGESGCLHLYNSAYTAWKRVWKRIIDRQNGKGSYNADDFFKQHMITMVMYGDEIVSMTCVRIFSVHESITLDLPYFDGFSQGPWQELVDRQADKLMSIEYNTIFPKYSLRKSQFPFVEAILHLNALWAKTKGVDCCLGVTRDLTGVESTVRKVGFKTALTGWRRNNSTVQIQLGFVENIHLPKEEVVRDFVLSLWNERQSYLSESYEPMGSIESESLYKNLPYEAM